MAVKKETKGNKEKWISRGNNGKAGMGKKEETGGGSKRAEKEASRNIDRYKRKGKEVGKGGEDEQRQVEIGNKWNGEKGERWKGEKSIQKYKTMALSLFPENV